MYIRICMYESKQATTTKNGFVLFFIIFSVFTVLVRAYVDTVRSSTLQHLTFLNYFFLRENIRWHPLLALRQHWL